MALVLVACEFSGRVRDSFIRCGHAAVSCDLRASWSSVGPHYRGDVFDILEEYPWDIVIAHPPCTYLSVSGARWFDDPGRRELQAEALEFACRLWACSAPRVAVENPVSVLAGELGPATQTIQPWQFGHEETKATCLWLRGLPPLVPTKVMSRREPVLHMLPPGPWRTTKRSVTYRGVARAMARQWGGV